MSWIFLSKLDDIPFYEQLGQNIYHRRKMLNISQEELSRRADCSQKYISKIETGQAKPSAVLCVRIAKALHCSMDIEKQLVLDGNGVTINVIVWKEKIGEKFCTYLMNMDGILRGIDTTTFNRNTVNFNHSVFVRSLYFDGKGGISLSSTRDAGTAQLSMEEVSQDRAFLRKLKGEIQETINAVLNSFLTAQASKAVQESCKQKSIAEKEKVPQNLRD